MTTRRWTLLLLLALGTLLAAVVPIAARPAGAMGGQAPDPVEVTEPEADVEPQEAPEPTSRPLFTESRRIVAIIGGLVLVALALALLTIRYWRVTKPMPEVAPIEPTAPPSRAAAPSAALDEPPAEAPPVVAPITSEVPISVAAADHRPDDAWEPRGTGEHAAIAVAADLAAPAASGSGSSRRAPAIARPGRAARRSALAQAPDGHD